MTITLHSALQDIESIIAVAVIVGFIGTLALLLIGAVAKECRE